MSYPQWIKTDNGVLVALEHIEQIYMRPLYGDETTGYQICAETESGALHELCRCADGDLADQIMLKLEKTLPIAVIDVEADVVYPLTKNHETTEVTP